MAAIILNLTQPKPWLSNSGINKCGYQFKNITMTQTKTFL
jgi:hypothetical protein